MGRPAQVVSWVGQNTRRIAVSVIGFLLVAVGLALLVLPGPGLLVLAAGLAVLATEYAWARRMLDGAKQKLGKARRRGRPAERSAEEPTSGPT